MAKRIVQMHDKYKSTTNLYPKVTMGSLSPQVKAYIESQGEQEEKRGDITAKLYIDKWGDYGIASVLETRKDATHFAECRVYGNKVDSEDIYGTELTYRNGNILDAVRVDKDGITLTSENDININTYGTSKLYINGVEYTGGGKKLYQHNIVLTAFSNNDKIMVFPIVNDSDTPFTISTLAQYLYNNGYTDNNNMIGVSGYSNLSGDVYWQGIFASTTSQVKVYSAKINQSYGNDITRITDNVKPL